MKSPHSLVLLVSCLLLMVTIINAVTTVGRTTTTTVAPTTTTTVAPTTTTTVAPTTTTTVAPTTTAEDSSAATPPRPTPPNTSKLYTHNSNRLFLFMTDHLGAMTALLILACFVSQIMQRVTSL